MAHLLFLSHAGADTDRAIRLAAAIEASPDAQKHGLKVWLDKRPDGPHRLHAGSPWQDQLERAIATECTAFELRQRYPRTLSQICSGYCGCCQPIFHKPIWES